MKARMLMIAIIVSLPGVTVCSADPANQGDQGKRNPEPIPEKLVVLTFDDSVKSHYSQVRRILKEFSFGGTFFITEGFTFKTNKKDYLTWEEIKTLHDEGFEIGNHTGSHLGITEKNLEQLDGELKVIEMRCQEHGIPKPVSFAWPGNSMTPKAFPILKEHGILFARRGGGPEYPYQEGRGFAYEPGIDDPLLVPSAGDARPVWILADFIRAVKQTGNGKIAVLQFHGVPEGEHPWVHTPLERFEEYMRYLHDNGYRAVALRELVKYVDPSRSPEDPLEIIKTRQEKLKQIPERLKPEE